MSDAYEAARFAVASEGAASAAYRLAPDPAIPEQHQALAASFDSDLQTVRETDISHDLANVNHLLDEHGRYLATADQLFAAIDSGDGERIRQLAQELQLAFDAVSRDVNDSAAAARATAQLHLAELGHADVLVSVGTPAVFIMGILLLGVFWFVLQTYHRRLDTAARSEVERVVELAANEQRALRAREERFRALVQNAADVILIVDQNGTISYASPAAELAWGYAPERLIGTSLAILAVAEDRVTIYTLLSQALAGPRLNIPCELRLQHADGAPRDCEIVATNLIDNTEVGGIVITCHDVTERRAYEREVERLAFHDELTGFPNRALFSDRLGQALSRADRYNRAVTVLFLDLDNFKVVNDSLGHEIGDRLLCVVAERIRDCLRPADTAARFGGDEFVVLLEEVDEEAVVDVAERIAAAVRQPVTLEGRELFPTLSIGIAHGRPREETRESLVRNADLAMYSAKANGKARHAVFQQHMTAGAIERLELETALRRAVEHDEFTVHYQPIISLESDQITEVEALIRWEHPVRGLMSPVQFIPLAEETGLIVPIGRWVIEQACRQAASWRAQYAAARSLVVNVNLSVRQFQHPTLVDDVAAILQTTGVEPGLLKLEITESAVFQDSDTAIRTLQRFAEMGIKLSIDDFGTGYSSLNYLKRFTVDTLKVDRSFVDGLPSDANDFAIVHGVIALAKSLNLGVTGEGIETQEQLDQLRELGCDRGQGFFLGEPLTAVEVGALFAGATEVGERVA